jgi:predicted PurR-regulated permease PerM
VPGAAPLARRAAPLAVLVLVAATLLALYQVADLVFVFFIAALIAIYLDALEDPFTRYLHLPRTAALLLALAVTLAALAGVVALLAPPLVQQTDELIAAVPKYLADLDGFIRHLAERYPVLRRAGVASSDRGLMTTALLGVAEFVRTGIIPYVAATGRILVDAVAVLVMAVYLSLRPGLYRDGLVALVPPRHRPAAREILRDLGVSLRAWVMAQLMAMVLLGVLTGIGLWALGVPYWLAFGIFAGLAALVPFFGTLFSTLLPALLVLGERGFLPFLAVASIGVVVHLIEANLVSPLLMQSRVALPPVLTILSVLVMAELAGPIGLVVAVPALATVMVVVRHVLLHHVYGDALVPAAAAPGAGGDGAAARA